MDDRDLVVAVKQLIGEGLEHAGAVGFVDPADPDHPERVEFRRAQGAHAGGAEHMYAFAQREQDLLVPAGGHGAEIAVHDPDRAGPARCTSRSTSPSRTGGR